MAQSQQLAVSGGSALMLPPPPREPRKRKPDVVLDEDTWTSTLEAIIERDFFPELPKLESKIAWLQAVRSGDPEQIRQAQLLIAQRRAAAAGGARPHTGATPANAPLFTPGGTAARALAGDTPYIPVLPPGVPLRGGQRPATGTGAAAAAAAAGEVDGDDEEEEAGEGAVAPPLSLDQFLANHTSEDNASFQEILDGVNKRRRLKHAAQLTAGADPKLLITDGRECTDGFGSTGQQPDTLIGWKYEPKNALYYDSATRDVVPYSDAELAAMVQGPPKAINHGATRFPKQLAGSASATPSSSSAGGSVTAGGARPAAGARGAAAAAAGGAVALVGGGTRGYDIMATPSFDPGVEESPFVTWGNIEATPLRIEAEDLPPGPLMDVGPSFFIKEGSRKEQKGIELASKAAASLRKKGSNLRGGTPLVTSALAAAAAARRQGTGAGGSAQPPRAGTGAGAGMRPGTGGLTALGAARGRPLSEAARKLATSLHKKAVRPDTDLDLRASYRGPTPSGSARRAAGARGATPAASSGGWSTAPTPVRAAVPGGATPVSRPVQQTLAEEELRVQALMKARSMEAEQRKELEAAREAAKQAFQQQQRQPAAAPAAGGGGADADLTSGLLNL